MLLLPYFKIDFLLKDFSYLISQLFEGTFVDVVFLLLILILPNSKAPSTPVNSKFLESHIDYCFKSISSTFAASIFFSRRN
jgi:hypothetical protein